MTGTIFNIEHGSFVDGPGIRTTVFLKGCNLHCAWCHNPESQSFSRMRLLFSDKCIHCGRCKAVCPSPDNCILCGNCASVCPKHAIELSGETVTTEEVLQEILSDRDFYGREGGVTFSGGECMLQPEFLLELLRACCEEGIRTAVDTAGAVPWEQFRKILSFTDLFLYDLKIMDPEKHRKYTGADNAVILDNYRRLIAAGKRIIVRMPIIPGVNDDTSDILALREFFRESGAPERTELLPYHRLGENKYRALGKEPVCFPVPEKDKISALLKLLS